ncbi:hypothetical protein [Kitasatospora sp. NPDC050543]|uniref:hypothetical protein n=1 Tax=Kitasatospora sp. NPDC050543 TaxID=3364054 RepID=UPI00379F93E9
MTATPTLRVLSLGAGVQSTTLALLSAEGRLPRLDAAVFADTGWEPAAVYQHLNRLEREVLQPAGIPLHRVSAGSIQRDVLDPNKQRSLPAHTRDPQTGEDGMLNRRCTQTYKLTPILRQVRLLLGATTHNPAPCRYCDGAGTRIAPWRAKLDDHTPGPCSVCNGTGAITRAGQPQRNAWAEQWIGFSTDEIGRVSIRADTRYSRSRHPLLELNMSRTQCEAYLKSRDWGDTEKSACIGCPFHGNAHWRQMRDTDPAAWAEAVQFDHDYRTGPGLRHERYLHISRLPLDQAPIDRVQRREHRQDDIFDALFEVDLERAEQGDPDGCSPWACRSGSAA